MESITPNKKSEVISSSSLKTKKALVVRTMKDDMRDAIERQHETSVSIAMAEEKKKKESAAAAKIQESQDSTPPSPRPIGRIIVIIAIVFILALFGAAYVFVLPKIKAIKLPSIAIHLPSLHFPSFGKPATTTPTGADISTTPTYINSLIPANSEKQFDITSKTADQISLEVSTERKQALGNGSIKNIYFFDNTNGVTTAVLIDKLLAVEGSTAPEVLTRSLVDSFMIGLIGESPDKATPFIILKVSDNDAGVAGMLAWEVNLPSFFDSVFGTTVTANITPLSKFRNIISNGKDTRALNVKSGESILYTFADQNTIIIAGSQSALETLLPLATKK